MTPLRAALTGGFAMFSMFFGSGNLVFPLYLGQLSLSNYLIAIMGLILTAVVVPFLGLLGMVLFDGDRRAYFSTMGRVPAFLLTFMMLALMGPFGVVPRCINVAFGGVALVFPELDLNIFSFVFCALTLFLVWWPNRVVEIIGVFLTPFKLGGIALLIIVGLWFGSTPVESDQTQMATFISGVSQGYQTMDLLAGFFFACTIIDYLRQRLNLTKSPGDMMNLFKYGLFSSSVGAGLLCLAYTGFVVLGAQYGALLDGTPPESLLAAISGIALGEYALPIVSFTIAISCLATATVLVKLFADFLNEDITQNRLGYHASIGITVAISFLISLFGFGAIVEWIGVALSFMYPALIVYAVYKIYEGFKLRRSESLVLSEQH